MTDKLIYCTYCQNQFRESALEIVCVGQGSRHYPRETEDRCPNCGANSDHHEPVPLCESCEDNYPVEDTTLCMPCTVDRAQSTMEER